MLIRLVVLVRPGEVLPVVDREVEMVQRVVRGPVDDVLERVAGDHVGVVDEDGPDVDEDEHGEVEVELDGEEEDEHVVWRALRESVDGVEGMRGEGCRDCPWREAKQVQSREILWME